MSNSTGKHIYNSGHQHRGTPNTPNSNSYSKKILHNSYSQNNLQTRKSVLSTADEEKIFKRKSSLKDLIKSRKIPIKI